MRLVTLPPPSPAPDDPDDPVARWAAVARNATDPCLVLDLDGRVAAMSPPAASLFGQPPDRCGSRLDEIMILLDFSDSARLAPPTGQRVPPIVAVQENQLSRGVLRVRGADGRPMMLDSVATPLHDAAARVVGALTFFAAV